jgi:hypothetical protein
VQFRKPEPTISQPDASDAFHLPPAALAIQAPEPREFSNAIGDGDRLDVLQFADELEIHPLTTLPEFRAGGDQKPAP